MYEIQSQVRKCVNIKHHNHNFIIKIPCHTKFNLHPVAEPDKYSFDQFNKIVLCPLPYWQTFSINSGL